MKMKNNIKQYKNPYVNQYTCPDGYHFERDNQSLGRIIWRRLNEIDGIYVKKDDE